jgi:hypothetical protein
MHRIFNQNIKNFSCRASLTRVARDLVVVGPATVPQDERTYVRESYVAITGREFNFSNLLDGLPFNYAYLR